LKKCKKKNLKGPTLVRKIVSISRGGNFTMSFVERRETRMIVGGSQNSDQGGGGGWTLSKKKRMFITFKKEPEKNLGDRYRRPFQKEKINKRGHTTSARWPNGPCQERRSWKSCPNHGEEKIYRNKGSRKSACQGDVKGTSKEKILGSLLGREGTKRSTLGDWGVRGSDIRSKHEDWVTGTWFQGL